MSLILTNRLKTAADMVRENRFTADVGTDHGYLPAFLVMSGKTQRAVASDIGEGPLENAAKTLRRYGIQDKVQLILSDGLKNVPEDAEEIVIAGMGGNLITAILSGAPWIKDKNKHFVLQPMTHTYDVRKYLWENGFYIDDEKICRDSGRVYVVISAYYSGEKKEFDDFLCYFGEKIQPNNEDGKAYISKQLEIVKSRYKGLSSCGKQDEAKVFLEIKEKAEKEFNIS